MDSVQRKIKYLLSPFILIVMVYLSNQVDCDIRQRDVNDLSEGGNRGCFANFCNETENYPYDEIKDAVDKHPEFHLLFGTVLSIPDRRDRRAIEDEDATCEVERTKIYPQIGLNTKKEVDLIVNVGDFKQEVSYVKCLNKKCQQRYKLVELVVLDEKDGLTKRKFSIPVRCQFTENHIS